MQLRTLQSTDHANWQQLWQAYQDFYQVVFNPELAQRTFSRLLDPQSGMGCQVIEQEQQLVALVHYVFHPSTWIQKIIAIYKIFLSVRLIGPKG